MGHGARQGRNWPPGVQPLIERVIEVMEELIRTNNVVTLSFVGTLLKEAGIRYFIADENMSVLDGSINALSRRLMVDADRANEARKLVEGAGLGDELRDT